MIWGVPLFLETSISYNDVKITFDWKTFPPASKNKSIFPTVGIQSPSENGFMEPKYYSMRFVSVIRTSQSSSENMTIDA